MTQQEVREHRLLRNYLHRFAKNKSIVNIAFTKTEEDTSTLSVKFNLKPVKRKQTRVFQH
jgi:hypothetical protein